MRNLVIGAVSGLLLVGLVACSFPTAAQQAPTPTVLPPIQTKDAVIAEARVVPVSTVSLAFEIGGVVAEVFVKEGDSVQVGAPLARLDTRELHLRVEQAQVNLEQAQAEYDRLLEGATPEQIAAAEAELARARGQLQATLGGVTQADLAAARAELESARARLAELLNGPSASEIEASQAAVDQARINLQQQRDLLSQAKVNAELNLERAANALRNAQDAYSRIYWDNREMECLPIELPQEARDREAAALRAVRDAEIALAQAQLALEQARQAEITGIATAEAALRSAEAHHEQLLSPPTADAIAAAQAQIVAAEARLARLTSDERAGAIASARAAVRASEARLAELRATPTDATLAAAAARVRGAEVVLKQAQLALERATLTAPISGTVVELNLKVGEVPSATAPAIILADLSRWQLETSDLTELSVVQVREGDPVRITFDALPDFELPGTVKQIKPMGRNRQGDIVYTVVITPNDWDERLRWNMTATVVIGE